MACMDARLNPLGMLGLQEGDAHVIRNAGGVVTDDEIRSLAISQRLLGTEEIILIHHTDCGMLTFTDDEFSARIQEETGIKPEWAAEAFTDLDEDVRQSIARIKASPSSRARTRARLRLRGRDRPAARSDAESRRAQHRRRAHDRRPGWSGESSRARHRDASSAARAPRVRRAHAAAPPSGSWRGSRRPRSPAKVTRTEVSSVMAAGEQEPDAVAAGGRGLEQAHDATLVLVGRPLLDGLDDRDEVEAVAERRR